MTDTNDLLNYELNKPKIPSTLNVLTILTFIGCGLGLLFSLISPMIMKYSKGIMEKAMSSGADLSDKQIADMQKAMPAFDAMLNNIVPIIIVGIIGVALCLMGAISMRKLKKDGFWLYVAGQIIPIVGNVILLGKYAFPDWKSYIWLIFPIVFIILYNAQRKYLVN